MRDSLVSSELCWQRATRYLGESRTGVGDGMARHCKQEELFHALRIHRDIARAALFHAEAADRMVSEAPSWRRRATVAEREWIAACH